MKNNYKKRDAERNRNILDYLKKGHRIISKLFKGRQNCMSKKQKGAFINQTLQ